MHIESKSSIIILGLGPGDPKLITREGWDLLQNINEIYLRTRQHPAVSGFPTALRVHSFDEIYDAASNFEEVYQQIVERVLELGVREQGVIYAVPGDPYVAEATSLEIVRRAKISGITLRVVHGMSFIEPALEAFELDPFPQVTLIDALELRDKHIPTFQPDIPVLVAQIYSQQIASDVKLILSNIYPDEHPIQIVHGAGTDRQIVEHIKLYELDRSPYIGLLSALYVPPLNEGSSFEAFLEIVAHLRAVDGCPWDKEQTHQSLRQHLMEETYELLAALDEDDPFKMQEELGDLLLQIYLHAQIASESGEFQITDILQGIYRKIINRHPHVFGDIKIKDSQTVLKNWERIKANERIANGKTDQSLFDSVPLILPALSLADQYQKRAARVGFDWKNIQGVQEKLFEEINEVKSANNHDERESEIGDLLFSVVNLSRWYQIDAESALRNANARFFRRFKEMEKIVKSRGQNLGDLTLDELEVIWQKVKRRG